MSKQFTSLTKGIVWCVVIVFSIRCFLSWNDLSNNFSTYNLFGYAGESISITTVIVIVYERWLWKFNPLEKTPVLFKKYDGFLVSSYDQSKYPIHLEIKQTLLSTNVILVSGESKSKSLSSSIDEILGETLLTYCYLNTPNSTVRHRSEIHYGTAMICIDNSQELKGHYFSDRKTIGDMELKAIRD